MVKPFYLLLAGILLLQPDPLFAKGNKHDQDGENDRSNYQERDDRYDKKKERRGGDKDNRRERGDDRRYDRSRQEDYNNQGEQRGGKGLPPGLAKKAAAGKSLPPGWQKKVAPGQELDPELLRYARPVSNAIFPNMPQTQMGTKLLQLEDKVVRINSATNTILEVLDMPGKTRR